MCFPFPPQQRHIDARLDGTSGPHLQHWNVPWSAHRWHASVPLRNPRGPFDCYDILWSDTVVQHHIPTAERHGGLLTPSKRTNVLHRGSDRARCHRVCWIDTDTRPRGKMKNRPAAACRILHIDCVCQLSGFAPAYQPARIQRPGHDDFRTQTSAPGFTSHSSLPFRLPDDTVLHPWTLKMIFLERYVTIWWFTAIMAASAFAVVRPPSARTRPARLRKNGQFVYQTSLKNPEPWVSMGHPWRPSGPKLGTPNPLFCMCTAICNAASS